ncbi:MAG: nucleotidyl transferase AbiEii/AbiGii toxin family protein [Bacteroidales bacterium]
MEGKLHYNTTGQELHGFLKTLMAAKEFTPFRLVGGTALSLLRGHRESNDIDLFTDAPYDSIDFASIHKFLCNAFSYIDTNEYKAVGLGRSYYIGNSEEDCVKLDLFYTDKFIQDFMLIDGIRIATIEEIIAMKIDVISRGGRKKIFGISMS